MNWMRVIESLIGTLVGGLIALASLWLRERLDRRRDTQAWYEDYYVTEGIDRLRSYFMMVELQLIDFYATGSVKNSSLPPVPYESVTRVVSLLDCRGLLGVIALLSRLSKQFQSRAFVWDLIGIVKMVGAHLDHISKELSKQKILAKQGIHSLAKVPKLSALRDQLEADIDTRSNQLDASMKRNPELEAKAAEPQ